MAEIEPIPVAVIGVGAFGRNHARVYHQLSQSPGMDRDGASAPVRLVGVIAQDLTRAAAVAKEFQCGAFGSVEQLIETRSEIRAASVAVPTMHHLQTARTLMQAGIDVLIEKPVASNLAEADELMALAKNAGRIAQVGHLERFNPAVRATIPLITRPMFFEVHRLSVFTPRSLDVDVVLDLMIHDLDAVLSFVNSPVKEIRAAGLPILSEKVDIANVRVEFESGCVANFTASRVSTERVRKLRFFQPRQYISIDYGRQDVLVFSVGSEVAERHRPILKSKCSGRRSRSRSPARESVISEVRGNAAESSGFTQRRAQRPGSCIRNQRTHRGTCRQITVSMTFAGELRNREVAGR